MTGANHGWVCTNASFEVTAFARANKLGRVMGNDIVLPRGNLSKRHSRIMFTNNQFMLVDLGSTNGTYLNGRRLQAACALAHGDVITLGDFVYRFELVK